MVVVQGDLHDGLFIQDYLPASMVIHKSKAEAETYPCPMSELKLAITQEWSCRRSRSVV